MRIFFEKQKIRQIAKIHNSMFRITETNREIAKVRVDELQSNGICLSKKSREIAKVHDSIFQCSGLQKNKS